MLRAGLQTLRRGASRQMSSVPESYSDRMNKTGRPISLHVWPTWAYDASRGEFGGGFIYRMPAVAWSSITMRMTGIFCTFGTMGVGALALVDSEKPARVASDLASSSVAPVAKFFVGGTLVYHYLGAIRHTIWDKTAKGFSNTHMLQSTYALVGATAVLSLVLASVS